MLNSLKCLENKFWIFFFVNGNWVPTQFSCALEKRIIGWPHNFNVLLGKGNLGGHPILLRKWKLNNHLIFFHVQKKTLKFVFHCIIFVFLLSFLIYLNTWNEHLVLFDVCCVNLKRTLNYVKDRKGIYLFQCRLNTW